MAFPLRTHLRLAVLFPLTVVGAAFLTASPSWSDWRTPGAQRCAVIDCSGGNRPRPAPQPRRPTAAEVAAERNRRNAIGLETAGNNAYARADYQTALNYYLQASALFPRARAYRDNVAKARAAISSTAGEAAWGRGDYAGALADYEQAYRLWPYKPWRDHIDRLKALIHAQQAHYDPRRSFKAIGVFPTGEFHVTKKNGLNLSAWDMKTIPFEIGDRMTTGPAGRVQIVLPDQTIFTLGPNSDMEMDEFVYDPASATPNKMLIGMTKGTIRFVTGKVQHSSSEHLKVKLSVITVGVRGTDVEIAESPDGTGSVKLYSGLAELTPSGARTAIELQPGQMITWRGKSVSEPRPIQ